MNRRHDDEDYSDVLEQLAAEAAAWRARWPGHCKACQGWGATSYQESHGFKGGGSETITDVCDRPLNPGTCHRCGCLGLSEECEGPCSACGWNFDDGVPGP